MGDLPGCVGNGYEDSTLAYGNKGTPPVIALTWR